MQDDCKYAYIPWFLNVATITLLKKKMSQITRIGPIGRISPEDFCFQLTQEEVMSLSRSQFAITMQTKGIKGGRSYLPYVFTEQGIITLAGVLHSKLADKMVVEISRVFVSKSCSIP